MGLNATVALQIADAAPLGCLATLNCDELNVSRGHAIVRGVPRRRVALESVGETEIAPVSHERRPRILAVPGSLRDFGAPG